MRFFSRGFYLLALIFFMSTRVFGQTITYKGIIIDKNRQPIAGATIFSGSDSGTSSNANGQFQLQINIPARVQVSYIGYKTRIIIISQVNSKMDTVILNEEILNNGQVVVTGNKRGQNINEVTQSMEVINQNFLIETQTTEVQKALEKIPGIIVQKDQVSIRGASGFSYGAGSRVLVMLDDMPMLSADASDPKWDYYPIENINQIEILKGAASSLYGSAAMEGVINLRTAVASDTPYTMIKMYGGVYDHPLKKDTGFWAKQKTPLMLSGVTIAHRESFGPLKVTASIYFNNDDGYRQDDNSYISRFNLFMQYAPPKNNRWLLTFGVNGMEDNGQLFLFAPDVNDTYVPYKGTSSTYHYFRWHTDFTAKYYLNDRSKLIFRSRYFTTVNDNNTNQSSTGHLWYNELQYQNQLFANSIIETNLTTGINYTLSQTLSDSLYKNHTGNNVAAYAQIDQKIGRFNFNVGARFEINKIDTFHWDYAPVFRAGLNYKATDYTFIRASIGQGFRYPSVAEGFASTSAGTLKIFPNPTLSPEKGWSSEIGIRQLFGFAGFNGYVDASAFVSEYKNMIEYIFGYYPPAPGLNLNPNYFGLKAQNIENKLIEGFEVSSGIKKDFGHLHADFSGGYTFVLPYNKDSLGKKLSEPYHEYLSFRHRDMVKANLNLNYGKIGFGFYSFYNSPFLNLDQFFLYLVKGLNENNYWMPYSAGFVADVRLSYKIRQNVNLSFFAKNVFNKEYMEVPGNVNAQRNFQLQVVWEF